LHDFHRQNILNAVRCHPTNVAGFTITSASRQSKNFVGRPRLPKDIQALICQMATENPTWGQEHIANELKLKLGLRVSPRTVGKYLREWPRREPDPSQRWLTFVRNHAQTMVACDFFVVVTARFRILYVLILMELGRRRILHCNVTDHPSAEWTLQQLREALPDDHSFRFLIHDRDSIFSLESDHAVAAMGVRVLRTPPRAPKVNAVCERVVGTIRRECLDFLIPLGLRHLKHTLNRWILHYNHGRVHMSLGPGIPAPLIPSPPPLRASTPASTGPPSASQSRAGWTAPRVLVGKGRRMSADVVIAHHTCSGFRTDQEFCSQCGRTGV
jgi:transposase InsO family protein